MRLKEIVKRMNKNQALGIAFFFWACLGVVNYNFEIEEIKEPIFAILNEILINLDPIIMVKGGRALDPHDFVNWWEQK